MKHNIVVIEQASKCAQIYINDESVWHYGAKVTKRNIQRVLQKAGWDFVPGSSWQNDVFLNGHKRKIMRIK